MTSPNDVWTADYKGQFRMRNGRYCFPLTVADGCSRYLLGCQGRYDTRHEGAQPVFRALFREHGLPLQLLTDNGVPFVGPNALAGLSRLSAWWIRLGIHPIRIEPGCPNQNGRHERMHRTLADETTRPPSSNMSAQQRSFNGFRHCYNHERPHDALGGKTPSQLYSSSPRPYPERLPPLDYPQHFEKRKVATNGCIKWHDEFVIVSRTLIGDYVGLEEVQDGIWSVYYGPVELARLDERDGRLHP
jgi:transposase InsO family protein